MALSSLARSVIIGQWSDVIDHWSVVGKWKHVDWRPATSALACYVLLPRPVMTADLYCEEIASQFPWSQPGDFHYLFVKLAFAICIPGQPH